MSFIDKFLDITNNIPREIVRLLKLYKFVEERFCEINTSLKGLRNRYLNSIKTKDSKDSEIKIQIDKYYKELLSLSDYKQNLIKDIEYILENHFSKKLPQIIEEGQKECKEQIISSNLNLPYGANSFTNSIYNNATNEDKSISEINEKGILGNKTKKPTKKKNKLKNINSPEYSEDLAINQEENEVYCICNGASNGEMMIECDDCGKWFHHACVNITPGKEPDKWSCQNCSNSKHVKKKKKEKKQ